MTTRKNDITFSGMQPTGRLHIGNYLGALKNLVDLQSQYQQYCFVADLHSLNAAYEPKEKRQQTINLVKDYLAAGLNPERCTIFVQSDVPQHSELAIILANVIPVSYLFRMTQYKDKSADRGEKNINAGLLYYPVLMAADILLYKATKIPVGQDQTQHVELARDTAAFFNKRFGIVFPEPQPQYTVTPKIMSLSQPDKKMSKSYGDADCIYIDDEPEAIKKKIGRAVTDTGEGTSQGALNLLELLRLFAPTDTHQIFQKQQQQGTIKYSELKATLAEAIATYFADFRQKRKAISDAQAVAIMDAGAEKARQAAQITMQEVRKAVGLDR